MAWVCIWAALLHWLLAATNACNGLRYVTQSFGDTFGFYVATLYLQKGIEILVREFAPPTPPSNPDANVAAAAAAGYLGVVIALLTLIVGFGSTQLGTPSSSLFRRPIRTFLTDYGTVAALLIFTGISYAGRLRLTPLSHLPTAAAYSPTLPRPWLVPFYHLSAGRVFLALPFGALLTLLFYFDHNISSLLAQGSGFPLKKPAGFHWDLALLGLTTLVAGVLGLPAPNGLIPQAPFHTASLCVRGKVTPRDSLSRPSSSAASARSDSASGRRQAGNDTQQIERVVEQRVSNTIQGPIFLLFMTAPFLSILALIPRAALAGLFFIMALQAYCSNGLTHTLLFLMRDRQHPTSQHDPLRTIRRRGAVWKFLCFQLVGFAATLAVTETLGAIAFPAVIVAMVPVRACVLPRYFGAEELAVLDRAVASEFTAESFGGVKVGGRAGRGEEKDRGEKDAGGSGSGSGSESGASSGGVVGDEEIGVRERSR